jgi:hypothetical protein
MLAHGRRGDEPGRVIVRARIGAALLHGGDIRPGQKADEVAIMAGHHGVLQDGCRGRKDGDAHPPACTQMPVESLKSSATRPSNTRPFKRSSGSASRMASPMR